MKTKIIISIIILITCLRAVNYSPFISKFECGILEVTWPDAPGNLEGTFGFVTMSNGDNIALGYAGSTHGTAKYASFWMREGKWTIINGWIGQKAIVNVPYTANIVCSRNYIVYLPLTIH